MITIPEAAARSGRHTTHIWKLAVAGRLGARRHGWRWLVSEARLEDYVRGRSRLYKATDAALERAKESLREAVLREWREAQQEAALRTRMRIKYK